MKCPECEQGKTENCALVALDFEADSFVPCETTEPQLRYVPWTCSGCDLTGRARAGMHIRCTCGQVTLAEES